MEKISITHFNGAHSDWLRSLSFYKEEIKTLKNRLTEIAAKNSNVEVMKNVDHYENQFEIQLSNIRKIKHNIESNIHNIAAEAMTARAGYIDDGYLEQHNELEDQFAAEESTIKELRHEFNQFASHWL